MENRPNVYGVYCKEDDSVALRYHGYSVDDSMLYDYFEDQELMSYAEECERDEYGFLFMKPETAFDTFLPVFWRGKPLSPEKYWRGEE